MQHPRLKRLLEKWQQEGRSWPEGMTDLCEEISRNFYDFDREKKIMEQSIAASQEDYTHANQRLLQLNQDLERQVALRTKEKDMLADFPLENPNPVFRINTNGHIVYQNPPALSIRVVEYQSKAYLIADFLEAFPTLLKTAAGNMEVKSEGRIFSITYKKLPDDDINLYCLDVTDQKQLQEKAYDNFYRLNNFLESTDAVYYIIYKNHPEKSFFTSRWPLFFGFNPTKTSQPLLERQKSILPASLEAYQEAMRQLDFSGQVTFKYQIENAVTRKQLWLEEEVKKKFDPFLNDEVLTGRITDVSGAEFYREYILESEKRFKRVTDSLPVSREPIDGVFSIKGQDGEYHYIHEIAVPRFLESGQFVGYIGAYFDLTKEYQYQKELEADKQQFELIAQNSSDVTVITDWKGKISYISPGVSRLLGYTPDEIKGTSLYELYCEECWKMLKPRFTKKELQGAGIKTFTFRLIKKDKELLWVETAVRTIDSPTDKNQNLLFHIRDVHEQKMAHQALESSEEKYRTLFENMDLGVLEVDQEEQIIYANNAMERITGYTISEMKGQVASRLFISSEEDKKILSEQERGRKKGKESIYELNMTRKSGEIARLVISGAPVFDMNGKVRGSVGIHWDVTRIRSMEQQLLEERINQEKYILEAKLQAEEDQRSQIGRDLHDGVGQMLAYMSLFLNMIKSKAVYDPVDIAQLEKTVKQTLEQVRTLSRTLAPPAIRDLGLRDSVVELVDSYGILTKPVFKLKVYSQAEDARITLDKKIVIFRVLQELLNNTFKYADADTISIHLYFKGTDLHMDYVDDGKGFDIAKIQKGVGLDSMRSRIGFYKGLIEIRSAPGKGTKTFIQLPTE